MPEQTIEEATSWTDGSFPRDTLVFALGRLIELAVDKAMEQTDVRHSYGQWLLRAQASPELMTQGETLLTANLGDGSIMLAARAEPNEFCMTFRHPRFGGLLAAGVELSTRRLVALYVARFEGSVVEAVRFSRGMAEALQRQCSVQVASDALARLN